MAERITSITDPKLLAMTNPEWTLQAIRYENWDPVNERIIISANGKPTVAKSSISIEPKVNKNYVVLTVYKRK